MKKMFVFFVLLVSCLGVYVAFFEDFRSFFTIQERMMDIEDRLFDLERSQSVAYSEINRVKILADRFDATFPSTIDIDPSSSKFQIVSCKSGLFAVWCENVKQYSTGSEVELCFVNMHSIYACDVEIHIEYAKEHPYQNNLDDFFKHRKEAVFKIDSLVPGVVQSIKLRVPEYKPEQLGHMSILSVSVTGINFIRPYKKP